LLLDDWNQTFAKPRNKSDQGHKLQSLTVAALREPSLLILLARLTSLLFLGFLLSAGLFPFVFPMLMHVPLPSKNQRMQKQFKSIQVSACVRILPIRIKTWHNEFNMLLAKLVRLEEPGGEKAPNL